MRPVTLSASTAPVRVLFAGGGTGGHLYPGLAIAKALHTLEPQAEPFFVGAMRGVEREILPESGFPYLLLDLHPLYRRVRDLQNNALTVRGAITAWRTLDRAMAGQMPVAAVGTGGYAAAVALGWSVRRRIPIALHEPDSHPGLTTRLFSRRAKLLLAGFAESVPQLVTRAGAVVMAPGAPVDPPPAVRESARDARARWAFPEGAFVVLVTGGSQGALALNDAVAAWLDRGLPDGVALIWGTGRRHIDTYRHLESPMVRVRDYLSPISEAYAAASLAVTRAGAMTIAELGVWGIPSLLVPLPSAARDHQSSNALAVEQAGAAVHIPQRILTGELLDETVRTLMRDDARLAAMQNAALARAQPDAALRSAEAILQLIKPTGESGGGI